MIRRIIRKRHPAPSLPGISLEEELALLRVELMYGLRVNREDYLRRKVDERNEVVTRLRGRDAATILADLRGSLERAVAPGRSTVVQLRGQASVADLESGGPGRARESGGPAAVVDLGSRRQRQPEDPEPA